MKKIVSIVLVATLIFALTGCGGSQSSDVSDSVSKGTSMEESVEKSSSDGTDSLRTTFDTNEVSTETEETEAELLPMEIKDAAVCISSPPSEYSDDIYMDFVGVIHNPNTGIAIEFPDFTVTLKDPDGSIIATEDQMGGYIAPGDTVTLVGLISAPVADISENTQIEYDVDCSDISTNIDNLVRTTDFLVEHVSERNGEKQYITGEITNTTEETVDMANVSMILRKNGEIVFAENTFVDKLRPGKPVAFEFNRYDGWPEHDDIEISVQNW